MIEGPRVNFVMRENNPYIYTISKLSRFGYEIYTTGRYSEQPPEQPAHTSRMFLHGKMDVKIFLMFIVAVKYPCFNTQQGGIQNSHRNSRLIRHGNGLIEKWISKFSLCSL